MALVVAIVAVVVALEDVDVAVVVAALVVAIVVAVVVALEDVDVVVAVVAVAVALVVAIVAAVVVAVGLIVVDQLDVDLAYDPKHFDLVLTIFGYQ